MRNLLLLSATVILYTVQSCPPQYQLMEDKCIRPLYTNQDIMLDRQLPDIRNECAKDGARLPIIKSDAENLEFDRIGSSFSDNVPHMLALDMVCNSSSRLQWVDGTLLAYIPARSADLANFDCAANPYTGYSALEGQYSPSSPTTWQLVMTVAGNPLMILCVLDTSERGPTIVPTTTKGTTAPTLTTTAKLTTPASTNTTTVPPTTEMDQCGEYSMMTSPTDDQKPCIKIVSDALPWEQAQQRCAADFGSLITINSAEENKYFWRTAIGNHILEDMHIGAHKSAENSTMWTWSDGEIPISDNVYRNFFGSFPIPGAGDCAAILTESSAAKWTNEDCTDNPLPFICRRADFTTLPKTCPDDTPPAGEDIFPPGFPDASHGCEYLLFVDAKKLVELELMTLVANENRDFLEILEGPAGPNLLANLTGTILTSTKFRTEKSNVMRVNWLPFGKGNGRGFRLRYNEIDD